MPPRIPSAAPASRAIPRTSVARLVRQASTLAALFILAACGGGDGAPVPVASVTLTMPAASAIIAGTAHQLTATTLDANGNALSGRTVTWTTGSDAIATISAGGLLTAVAPGQSSITATSEGKIGTVNFTVLPIPVASVSVTPGTVSLVEGGTQSLTATALSASGAALPGRTMVWGSADPAIATVGEGGLVTAVSPGTTQVLATSEGRTGSATITVTPRPVATVSVEPSTATVAAGRTLALAALTRIASGAVVTGREVTWATSDASVATVSGTGVVTGVAPGIAIITATSEGQHGTAGITVTAATPAPTITGIAPASLVPGTTSTITGTGFAAGATVTVGGVTVPAVIVSPTELTVVAPCVATGSVGVRVTVDGRQSAIVQHPLAVTERPVLKLGQSVVLGGTASGQCTELPAATDNVRYLVTVFSMGGTANTQSAFELRANAGATAAPGSIAAPVLRADLAPPATPLEAAAREHDRVHARFMERDRADVARLRDRLRATGRLGTLRELAPRDPPPAVGSMRDLRYAFNSCNDSTTIIRARAIYVGPHAVLWEDEANALQSANDASLAAAYQRLGAVYERDQHATIAKYFGDPLRRDDVLDNDDRVHMVFTQRLNGSGAAAFVTGCDQFPRYNANGTPLAPASNLGEFFYSTVPTTAGSNPNSTAFPDGWYAFLSRTVVHEVKHIASVSARVANGAPPEAGWLEEGSARMAEEMWVRDSLHRTAWMGNAGFGGPGDNGVYCDFHLTDAACNANDAFRRPTWGMRRQLGEIRQKLLQPWNWSPYGDGTGQGGAVFYNTTWSLLRYAIDRYATSEASFLTALTQSQQTGLANIASVAGASGEQLIGGWGMALYADDYPGLPTTNPDLQFRTWNLRSIYAGLNASPSWSGTWTSAWPVQATPVAFGSFVTGQTVRGGAHAFYVIEGPFTAPLALQLRGAGDTAAPSVLRVAIARLQ